MNGFYGNIASDDIYNSWLMLMDAIMRQPVIAPRKKPCRELIGVRVHIANAYNNIIVDGQRKINYKFMVGQWLTTLLGLEDKVLEKYLPRLSEYESDGQGGLYPSYGPRLFPQWPAIMKAFRDDWQTRQAVMSIWEPQRVTAHESTRYVPCTLSLQFLLRPAKEEESFRGHSLHIIASMRSSDAWLGLPYDIYNFTMLGNHLLSCLQHVMHAPMRMGSITLNLGSSHIYEENWEPARSIINAPTGVFVRSPQLPSSITDPPFKEFLMGQPMNWHRLQYPWLEYYNVLNAGMNYEALTFLKKLDKTS